MTDSRAIAVHIVTFNHCSSIEKTVQATLNQKHLTLHTDFAVTVIDNNSTDGTPELIERTFPHQVTLKQHPENLGFCRAHNLAIRDALSKGYEFVLILNPDLALADDALSLLRDGLLNDPRVGATCPRLYRADENLEPATPPRFDATGMYITPALRHFDRGSEEKDTGQYEEDRYVFGASGATLFMSRAFILDLSSPVYSTDGDPALFDEAFFAYREDADLAWRSQWLGWRTRYVAAAKGYHIRKVLPDRRKHLPPALNAYGVKNRFLLQLNNFCWIGNLHCILPGGLRNLLVIGGTLTVEQRSLPSLLSLFRELPTTLKKRRSLATRRRVSPCDISRWFKRTPYTEETVTANPAAKKIESVHIVIVNYNSAHRLKECLASIETTKTTLNQSLKLHVTVVDNASEDQSASSLKDSYADQEDITIQLSPTNWGFAGAINRAVAAHSADAILVLNPDVVLNPDALSSLVSTLGAYEKIGALAPTLCNPDGTPQFTFTVRNFPSLGSTLAELFFIHRLFPNNPWTAHYLRSRDGLLNIYLRGETPERGPYDNPELPLPVSQPAGACLLIRKEAFHAVNGLDESFWPAWFEDVDLCKRLEEKNWQRATLSTARVIHEGGYSTNYLAAHTFARAWYSNLIRYWKKHGTHVEYIVLRSLLPIALVLRGLVAATPLLRKSSQDKESRFAARRLAVELLRLTTRTN